jgi:hypothetical protein
MNDSCKTESRESSPTAVCCEPAKCKQTEERVKIVFAEHIIEACAVVNVDRGRIWIWL